MNVIVLISGTSGSGKTYIVREIIKELPFNTSLLYLGSKNKLAGYLWDEPPLAIMGNYSAACGGCDSLSWKGASDEIEQEIIRQRDLGRSVILEGLLVGTWGVARMGRLVPYGLINILLDTPVEECVASVEARRAEKAAATGKELKPFNPDNTVGKHGGLLSVLPLRRAAGIPVEVLSREAALARVREIVL